MVAFNTDYAPSKTSTRSQNRVGDFFCEGADCVGRNRLASRIGTKEKTSYSYETASGRPVWPNRDPIGEWGGLNLYAIVGNDLVNRWDVLGLSTDSEQVVWLAIEYFRGGSLNLSIGAKTPQLIGKVGKFIQKALSKYENYETIVALGGTAQPIKRLWKSVPKCYVPKDLEGIKKAGFTKVTRHWFNEPRKPGKPMEAGLSVTVLYLDINYWRSVETEWIPDPDDPCCK
jgi:hypothetical protein